MLFLVYYDTKVKVKVALLSILHMSRHTRSREYVSHSPTVNHKVHRATDRQDIPLF